jgi:protoheme IX farnesyltransferase
VFHLSDGRLPVPEPEQQHHEEDDSAEARGNKEERSQAGWWSSSGSGDLRRVRGDRVGHLRHSKSDGCAVVGLLEKRHHVPPDVADLGIVELTFKSVADVDPPLVVVDGEEHDNAFIRPLAPYAPRIRYPLGELRGGASLQLVDGHDGNLGAGFLVKCRALRLNRRLRILVEHSGVVAHVAGGLRQPLYRFSPESPGQHQQNRQYAPHGPHPTLETGILDDVAISATSGQIVSANAAETQKTHTLLSDYAILFKLRVSVMVVITAGAGFYLGSLRSGISPFHAGLFEALAGVTVVTLGSSALNQALERKTDLLMHRTADRPMAAGRIGLAHGLTVGFLAVFLGSLYLAIQTNVLTGALTLLTAIAYVAIYTPLKRVTVINTFIGAFPGALPPLIGWTAVRGVIEWPAVALFAIMFVWQFPHFMAIGWMYRDDYAAAGVRLTPTNPDIRWAARSTVIQSLFYAVLMIPVALWPTWLGITGIPYAVVATILSFGYLFYTVRFARIARHPESPASRRPAVDLLRCSVIYLPLLLAAMMLNAQGRLLF